jgi:predicted nucleotidyltransferase
MVANETIPDLSRIFGPRGRDFLADAVTSLRNRLPVSEVWLFGSCARGDAKKGSDLDLMVVLRDDHGILRPTLECFKVVNHLPDAIGSDVIAISKSQWLKEQEKPFGVFGSVLREGVCLYAE